MSLHFQLNILSIDFLGALPFNEALKLVSNSDVYISSSLSEGLPLSVLEALSLGCAAVLSDIPAHRDICRAVAQPWVNLYTPSDFNSFLHAFKLSCYQSILVPRRVRMAEFPEILSDISMEAAYHSIFTKYLEPPGKEQA